MVSIFEANRESWRGGRMTPEGGHGCWGMDVRAPPPGAAEEGMLGTVAGRRNTFMGAMHGGLDVDESPSAPRLRGQCRSANWCEWMHSVAD
jgi:hypothetical protein